MGRFPDGIDVSVGGIVILCEEPEWMYLPSTTIDGFIEELMADEAIKLKGVNGPLPNGITAITCEWDGVYPYQMLLRKIWIIFRRYLESVENLRR